MLCNKIGVDFQEHALGWSQGTGPLPEDLVFTECLLLWLAKQTTH